MRLQPFDVVSRQTQCRLQLDEDRVKDDNNIKKDVKVKDDVDIKEGVEGKDDVEVDGIIGSPRGWATTMSKVVLVAAERVKLVLTRQKCSIQDKGLMALGPVVRYATGKVASGRLVATPIRPCGREPHKR